MFRINVFCFWTHFYPPFILRLHLYNYNAFLVLQWSNERLVNVMVASSNPDRRLTQPLIPPGLITWVLHCGEANSGWPTLWPTPTIGMGNFHHWLWPVNRRWTPNQCSFEQELADLCASTTWMNRTTAVKTMWYGAPQSWQKETRWHNFIIYVLMAETSDQISTRRIEHARDWAMKLSRVSVLDGPWVMVTSLGRP